MRFKIQQIFRTYIIFAFAPHFCLGKISPPLELEWETNPDIFSNWPKSTAQELKGNLKSPSTSEHKYLPLTTKPIEYLIKLRLILESEIDEEELTAQGSVRILMKCVEATKQIVMHTNINYVTILQDSVQVREAISGNPSAKLVPIVNQTFEVENDFYIIHLASPCRERMQYFVDINFITDIATDSFTGLYLSTYVDPSTNITRRLATTQFEDEHSRKMFPNYDNPDFKAKFKMILGRHADYKSFSNMNIEKTEENKELADWYWDHYAPTPVMSSYLLAVIVSDFTCVSDNYSIYKKFVEVCGPPYMIEQGGGLHSTEVVATILAFYDKFMKKPYPLPKMTSVAIPDFQAGAMENWGLNTYRIKGLIYYPNKTSEVDRYRIDLTISHELAHQNFGNLVTTKYWNQIWLNEGFATYISYYGLKSISPEYDPEKQWVTSYRRRALTIDASEDTRPLVNITDPFSYFDAISYSKGASLLRMMENFLTEKVFHRALQVYLGNHAYDTATQWNLFEVLDTHARLGGVHPSVATVSEIMETWTLQKGFPLIRVDYISNRMITISQERFFDVQSEVQGNVTGFDLNSWYIPITTSTQNSASTLPIKWLKPNEPSAVIYFEKAFDWLIVNPNAAGFGRIIYDLKLAELVEQVFRTSPHLITPVTRSQIIEDAFEIAWAGYGMVETALNLTKYLHNEQEPVVWSSALNGLGKIYVMFAEDDEALQMLQGFISERLSAALASVGVEQAPDEKGTKVLHRASLLSWGGVLRLPEVLGYATNLVQSWTETASNTVPSDLHSLTYCNAIIGGDKDLHDKLAKLLQDETDDDLKSALARSLGCSLNEDILKELRFNLTGDDISPDLSYELMLKLTRNSISRKTMLEYFEDNFEDIQDYFGGIKVIARSLASAAQYWNTEARLKQLETFIERHEDAFVNIENFLKRVVKEVEKNISWVNKFAGPVKKWLKQNQ